MEMSIKNIRYHYIVMNDMKDSSPVPSITDVLKKISDDKTLILFNSIAVSKGDRNVHLKEMSLSTKQYYSRLSGLMAAGLIRRLKGKYSLTLIGDIVYDAHLNIGRALSYYWKLKAIESIEMSEPGTRLPKEELIQLINALVDNRFIKDFLIKYSLLFTLNENQRLQDQQQQQGRIRNFRLMVFHFYRITTIYSVKSFLQLDITISLCTFISASWKPFELWQK
jgi:hypothetical protein